MLGRTSSLRALRWTIVTLAVVLSVVLLLRGDVIIGGLIGASAVLRITYLLSSSRARGRYRGAGDTGRAGRDYTGAPGPVRPLLRGLAPQAFEVAAGLIGVSAAELHRDFRQGRSIAEAATAKNVSVDAVVAAVVNDAALALDRAVAQGTTSSEIAGRAKDRLPMWAARLVYGTRGEFQSARGRR
ncbi:MAG: hypothetical protein ACLPQS_15985 [Acidimicrobiales bacterium]